MTAVMLSAAIGAAALTGCSDASGSAAASEETAEAEETEKAGKKKKASEEETGEGKSGKSGQEQKSSHTADGTMTTPEDHLEAEDIETETDYTDSSDGGHAITAEGTGDTYEKIHVVKTGEADGDEADFYGENAAVFAADGASLTITDAVIETDGTHANGVFSYGEGTTVTISDSVIETEGDCSGGLMTTGGGTMNAKDLTVETAGRSSAAIRSDRGGGTVNVTGGYYSTSGTGSPVIYSTADITVSNACLVSTASQGVVVEGDNSVTLIDDVLTADNTEKNSDKSDTYQAVMIYQSMSGDADTGTASFAMEGGSLTNLNGDIFFVNNTACTIDLTGAKIVNEDEEGIFLRAEAAGWGTEGSNGGQVILTASDQTIDGDMAVDEVSALDLYLKDDSSFTGAVNSDGQAGQVYVEIESGSVWTLTGDSYITALTCGEDAIDLNGYTLYVNGKAYEAGTSSQGEAIEIQTASSGQDGKEFRGERPDGEKPDGEKPEGRPEGGPDGGNGRGGKGGPGQGKDFSGERPADAPEGAPEGGPAEGDGSSADAGGV